MGKSCDLLLQAAEQLDTSGSPCVAAGEGVSPRQQGAVVSGDGAEGAVEHDIPVQPEVIPVGPRAPGPVAIKEVGSLDCWLAHEVCGHVEPPMLTQ